MARNIEKARFMLNKWTALKEEMSREERVGLRPDRRPYLVSECKSLPDAERWRRQVIGEISRKVAEIQNAGLGEPRVRELNDEINKLMREKHMWEKQIMTLGGADYTLISAKQLDGDGKELPGGGGYKYFGAAKDLPGVRELFAAVATEEISYRTRGEISKNITPDYYGYRDEDDGTLVPAEQEGEEELLAEALARWKAEQLVEGRSLEALSDTDTSPGVNGKTDGEGDESTPTSSKFHIPVERTHIPTQEEIQEALLAKKKELLLKKYAL